jgi:O-antigen ligase
MIGSYGRDGGMILLTLLSFVLLCISFSKLDLQSDFLRMFHFSYYSILIFGFFEMFNLVPFKQSRDFNALSLTLSNPNFASALIGIFISTHITYIVIDKSKQNFVSFFIILGASLQLFLIKSLQGFLIVFLMLIFLFIKFKREMIWKIPIKLRILISILILPLAYVILFQSVIGEWIYQNGSVKNRLSYWKLSLEVFKDHPLFGVGIDNLRSYAISYRDLNLTIQEGTFTIPDRSHNVFIDHFVNGGIFAGLLWLVFALLISYIALRMSFSNKDKYDKFLIIVVIWFGYLVQSAISVDHMSLTLLGYISAGLIVFKWNNLRASKNNSRGDNPIFSILSKSTVIFVSSISLIFCLSFMPGELTSGKIFYQGKVELAGDIAGNSKIQAQTLEQVMVKFSQEKKFALANVLADKLLKVTPNSHQAFYVKSVFFESIGDDLKGKQWMLKAHESDKWNPVYLLSLGIYEYKLGNLEKAQYYIKKTEEIKPNQQGLELVKKLISQSSTK